MEGLRTYRDQRCDNQEKEWKQDQNCFAYRSSSHDDQTHVDCILDKEMPGEDVE